MSIYGNLVNKKEENLNENWYFTLPLIESSESLNEDYLEEAKDPEKVSIVSKVNGSIRKSLYKIGVKASVKEHKITHDVYKFTHNKKESFKVDIMLEAIESNVLATIIRALPLPDAVKIIILSIINGNQKNLTIEAIKVINAAEDVIKEGLKKDISDVKLNIQSIERDKRYTNAIIMTISMD